jgi:hypothetical protein
MMTRFWEGLGGKLGENWAAALVAPAAIFWAGGFGAWVLDKGWDDSGQRLVNWFAGLTGVEQALLAIGGLLALSGAAAVANAIVPTLLRLLEGYFPWGLRWLASLMTKVRGWRIGRAESDLQLLEAKRRSDAGLTEAEQGKFVRCDLKLRRVPAVANERRATNLGDTLKAAESWPRDKYGLDTAVVWPRLWLVLSDGTKQDITTARGQLDQAVVVWIWGLLLVVWVIFTWWALLAAALVILYAYWRSVRVAETYGDLVEAAFDLYRNDLYKQLRVKLPTGSTSETDTGTRVTAFLWRGEGAITWATQAAAERP